MAKTTIGGSGYRWQGKSIRSVFKDGASCISMPRKDSAILGKIVVESEGLYKVTVIAARSSGNGALLVNFFGGLTYDGKDASLNVVTDQMQPYSVEVRAPKAPKSSSMCVRIRRPNNGTGNVFVKQIMCQLIENKIDLKAGADQKPSPEQKIKLQQKVLSGLKKQAAPKPGPRKRKGKNRYTAYVNRLRDKKEAARKKKPPKEENEMIFKPYDKSKVTLEEIQNALIADPSDVPKVSIITPTRDGLALIKECWASLKKNTAYPNWEWVVGDSDSADGTADYIKGLKDDRIKLIERGTADGSFSSINNELVKYASGQYLVFLNDDTKALPFWLYQMMYKIHNRGNVGAVGAKLLYGAKDRVQHCGIAFSADGPCNIGKSVLKSFPKNFAEHDRHYQAVTAACMLVRKKDFDELNGFDEKYYFCYEDVDLCLRLKYELKKKIIYASKAVLIHNESVTQKKYKTAGPKQKAGIEYFKNKWMKKVELDFPIMMRDASKGRITPDLSFVTCINNINQYSRFVLGSLLKNETKKVFEVIPVLNFGNPYSASKALNIGMSMAKSNIIVTNHQDVLFYNNWINLLFKRIAQIEKKDKNWAVIGTAGITKKDITVGVVYSMKGKIQWQCSKRAEFYPVQTIDEHCMVIKKSSGLRFDHQTLTGFHFYGPDICLQAQRKRMGVYGILNPLVHAAASTSLVAGRQDFMNHLNRLAKKWRTIFPYIRTPTSIIDRQSVRTFVKFNG